MAFFVSVECALIERCVDNHRGDELQLPGAAHEREHPQQYLARAAWLHRYIRLRLRSLQHVGIRPSDALRGDLLDHVPRRACTRLDLEKVIAVCNFVEDISKATD